MPELLLHHTYTSGAAVDVSGKRNHGAVTAAPVISSGALSFQPPRSRVMVAPSRSLRRFGSLRARVRFRLDPVAADARHNLMEGHLAFALYVTPNATLTGTILDAHGKWTGPTSAGGLVQPGRWHVAELTYVDSAGRLEISLDGTVVASKYGVAGPVRPVGPLGISIGTWPDADRYTLHGQLDEAWLWATWPQLEDLVDSCCADLGAMDRLVDVLRHDPAVQSREVDPTEILRGLQSISARTRARAAGDDAERSAALQRTERQFNDAYQHRDLPGMLRASARGLRQLTAYGVPATELAALGREGLDLLRQVELGRRLLDPLTSSGARRRSLGGGGWAAALTHRARPGLGDVDVQLSDEERSLLADAARLTCLPVPVDERDGPSEDDDGSHWGRIDHEPWPARGQDRPDEPDRGGGRGRGKPDERERLDPREDEHCHTEDATGKESS